jgi:hypothetical protein
VARVIYLGGLYGAVGSWMVRAAAEAVLCGEARWRAHVRAFVSAALGVSGTGSMHGVKRSYARRLRGPAVHRGIRPRRSGIACGGDTPERRSVLWDAIQLH